MNFIRRLKSFFFAAGIPGLLLVFHPLLIVFVTRGKSLENAASVDGSSIVQILYLALCTLVVFREYFTKPQDFLRTILFKSPMSFLIIYIFICFISALWSSSLFLTLYRSFECLVFLLLITITISILIKKYNYSTVIKWTIWFAFWNLFVGVLFKMRLTGFNALSIPFKPSRLFFPLFFFIIIGLGTKIRSKILTFLVILFGLSNKIFIGIVLGLLSLFQGSARGKLLIIVVLIAIGVSVLYFGVDNVLLNTLFYGRESVGLEDSSGRDQVWAYLLSKSKDSPVFGYGFVAGELELLSSSVFKGAINAHNSIISALINVGYFGLVTLALFFIAVFSFALRLKVNTKKTKAIFIGTIILIIAVSMSSPGIGGRVYGSWVPSIYLISLMIGLKKYYKVIP